MTMSQTETQPNFSASTPAQLELQVLQANPDLVDRLFDYVINLIPAIGEINLEEAKAAVRQEFAGDRVYIRSRKPTEEVVDRVLRTFNGRNAAEVARELGISRATVYRLLKQPGRR